MAEHDVIMYARSIKVFCLARHIKILPVAMPIFFMLDPINIMVMYVVSIQRFISSEVNKQQHLINYIFFASYAISGAD